jgi:4,5-DOPA dioxygenase extradiol
VAAAEVHVPGRRHPRALSIDYSQPPPFHYELARRLRTLRSKGVLIIGSGNVVHNLGERGGTGITESPREWAVEFDRRMAAAVTSGRHADAIEFLSRLIGQAGAPDARSFFAVPVRARAGEPGRPVQTFCEGFQWPGISMRSLVMT